MRIMSLLYFKEDLKAHFSQLTSIAPPLIIIARPAPLNLWNHGAVSIFISYFMVGYERTLILFWFAMLCIFATTL